jgi:hypothetical protein
MSINKHDKLAEAGRRGGKARMASLEPEDRSALGTAAAHARWGKPTAQGVVDKMVVEIYRRRQPMALYERSGALWFASPDNIESPRWSQYLVGTYGVGVIEDDVMADIMAR